MKHISVILLVILSFILQTGYSQWNDIQELGYIPENITENDTIIIIGNYLFLTSPCNRDSLNIIPLNDTSFVINVYYSLGDGDALCPAIDSISIGRLSEGWYSIIFRLSATNPDHSESDTLFLTVDGTEVIDTRILNPLKIFPNPSRNQITLNGILEEAYVSIKNMFGQEVLYIKVKSERQIIDVSKLNRGIYIITLYDKAYSPIFSDKIMLQ
ncbi:MAG: T9SS type A sorting domain-containing protein [Bacteroidales bacterium]|nr:T9SS type A sorting domain-containing protein [Bacteroidales bacterium]